MNFFEDVAIPTILDFEGGYVNDPDDPGGATNFGITQKTYDRHRRWQKLQELPVKAISRADVLSIYKRNYWIDGGCRSIPPSYGRLALFHFDTCVNCGIGTAIRLLQKSVGTKADGVFGPITTKCVTYTPEKEILKRYVDLRRQHYKDLTLKNPKLKKFLKGWMIRIDKVLKKELPPLQCDTSQNLPGSSTQ